MSTRTRATPRPARRPGGGSQRCRMDRSLTIESDRSCASRRETASPRGEYARRTGALGRQIAGSATLRPSLFTIDRILRAVNRHECRGASGRAGRTVGSPTRIRPAILGLSPAPRTGKDEEGRLTRIATKGGPMNVYVPLACAARDRAPRGRPASGAGPDRPTSPAPIDVVSALETVVADAIARAEPSVVAIHREKGENPNETLAVRGKAAAQAANDPRRSAPGSSAGAARRADLVRLRLGGGDRRRGADPDGLSRRAGAVGLMVRAADRQAFEAEIIAADPRSDLAVIVPVAGARACPPPAQADRPGRRQRAAQGLVPDRPGQPVQRGPGRPSRRRAGASSRTSPGGSSRSRTTLRCRPRGSSSRTIRRCSSSTPSSTWG